MPSKATSTSCPICDQEWDAGCQWCGWQPTADRGLDTDAVHLHPLAPLAKTLATDVCPVEAGVDGHNPLRRLTSESETRLTQAGYNRDRRGVEVINVSEWQAKHDAASRTRLFEYLLRDSVVTHLWFYTAFRGESEISALREAVSEQAASAGGSESRLFDAYDWLQRIDAPTTYETGEDIFESANSRTTASIDIDADNTDQSSLTGF
jgi:hypothetical protein